MADMEAMHSPLLLLEVATEWAACQAMLHLPWQPTTLGSLNNPATCPTTALLLLNPVSHHPHSTKPLFNQHRDFLLVLHPATADTVVLEYLDSQVVRLQAVRRHKDSLEDWVLRLRVCLRRRQAFRLDRLRLDFQSEVRGRDADFGLMDIFDGGVCVYFGGRKQKWHSDGVLIWWAGLGTRGV
jgi:hypothetical protein